MQANLTMQELIGHQLRIVRPGEFYTQDIQPGRVTIFVDAENKIERIKIDPETDI